VRPEGPVGASAPTSALVGAWLGLVATRHLMGLPGPGGALSIDGPRGTTRVVQLERDPGCPFHRPLGEVTKVGVSNRDTVAELRAALPAGATPLLWEPVQQRAECPVCGFAEDRWGLPGVGPCPNCGADLRPRTTLELSAAPGELTLEALGVPPREVLAVRSKAGMSWVELTG
jgi:hypothetical protein